ncbi:TPA: acyl-CoA/acyl-ACP dehydrogenase [Campylobacter jejuni]|nr:acyl-CoA dehydrogenase [Campylobacter jejuni]ECL3257523.1 acyl-CoA dehydrogenase [Campylobacter coli]ECL2360829.1 acyl-CoA dehydrogenase [Campylobacter jejuni]ECL3805924.1 acyl-CoA dehydrogenase [Campylobacter jejuni]ECL9129458.1 acyl-CoA dehydrogenase [Campylobacter coli]
MQTLQKLVQKIDKEGYYPKDQIKALANDGFFAVLEQRSDIFKAVENISKISNICGTTGFCMWCQFALIWYVLNSKNLELKARLLPKLYSGEILGGTALSNPMKSFAGIEKNRLKAKKTNGGYIINGTLPWVSNIEQDSAFGAIALLPDEKPIMGVIFCDESVKLSSHIKYATLEGSATKTITLKDYFLKDTEVLGGDDIYEYLIKITPGFILLQVGIATGIINQSLECIQKSQLTHAHINEFLPYTYDGLRAEFIELLERLKDACGNIENLNSQNILTLRLDASLLTQKITGAAVLFSGAMGYLADAKPQRLQREGNFVLIITPSIKHILKELQNIQKGDGCINKWKKEIL